MSRVAMIALAITFCVGCGTPTAVKKLSTAQTQTLESYESTLKAYFDLVGRFADAQVKASNFRISLLTKQINDVYKADAAEKLAAASTEVARNQALSEYTRKLQANDSEAATQKQQIAGLVQKLKDKQNEMLAAYRELVSAQKKLDEYIQLKKVDDVVLDELTGILGMSRDKLTSSATDIAEIATQIDHLIPSQEKQP